MDAEELQGNVISELRLDPSVDATKIGVTATGAGTVTLTGSVPTYAEKMAAENIAKEVYGVRGVANDIEVELGPVGVRNDTEISDAAIQVLRARSTPFPDVKIVVQNGWITLTGEVDHHYQKKEAEQAVQSLAGVTGITNDLKIRPSKERFQAAEAKREIEESLLRRGRMDPAQIDVEVENSRIVLRGVVRSWSDFDEAEGAAWRVPGVLDVENRLTVLP